MNATIIINQLVVSVPVHPVVNFLREFTSRLAVVISRTEEIEITSANAERDYQLIIIDQLLLTDCYQSIVSVRISDTYNETIN